MRCHVKKKKYRMHVREMCISGQKNNEEGQWAPTSKASDGVCHNVLHGCLGAEPGVGRPKKGGSVKPKPEIFAARNS